MVRPLEAETALATRYQPMTTRTTYACTSNRPQFPAGLVAIRLHSRWRAPPPHHPRLPHSPLDAAARLESSARQWPDDLEIARLGSMSIDEEQFRPLQKRVLRQMAPAIDASKHSIMYSIATSMRFVVFRVHNRYARRVDTAFAWMCRAVAEVKHSTAM